MLLETGFLYKCLSTVTNMGQCPHVLLHMIVHGRGIFGLCSESTPLMGADILSLLIALILHLLDGRGHTTPFVVSGAGGSTFLTYVYELILPEDL